MQEWPFGWECGQLQWRTQLKGKSLAEIKSELERYLELRYKDRENLQLGASQTTPVACGTALEQHQAELKLSIGCAEKDLRLIEKWMDFCK